ncbi:MAG: hypothetical protein WCI18_14510 [Pseudomonadota bacterium]
MNQGNKSIAAWMIVTSLITLGCKRSDELISSTKLEDPTHTLDVVFSEETSKIEYKILGNGAENETVTSVKIIQNKRENVAQWLKEKITANFLPFASLQGNGYYPDYLLEVKSTNFTCTNQKGAYIGVKGNPIWCTKSANNTSTDKTHGEPAKTGDQPANTSTQTASSQTPPSPGPDKPIPKPPVVCTGSKIRAYKICRFFEGGAGGCYFRPDLNCLYPMTSSVCFVEKGLLTKEYENKFDFNSSWDCSKGVN